MFPPKPVNVETFGQLPSLNIGNVPGITNSSGYLFELETANYKLPDFGQYQKVYPVIEPKITLFSLQNARDKANSLGFTSPEEKYDEFTFHWIDPKVASRSFTYNIKSDSFKFNYDFYKDKEILENKTIIEDAIAINKAKSFLVTIGMDNNLLTAQKAKTIRLKIKDKKLERANSKAETDIARVNLFRADIEKIPVISANEELPEISILVSRKNDTLGVVDAQYSFWNPNLTNFSNYKIKSPNQAYDELKKGEAFVFSKPQIQQPTVKIRKIYLAYFNPPQMEKYFQPLIVFDGDNGFRAVVEAVNHNSTSSSLKS